MAEMIDAGTLGIALCTLIKSISDTYCTGTGNEAALIQECYYGGAPNPLPDFNIFAIVSKLAISPEQYIGMRIVPYQFQVDIYVRVLADPEQTPALLSTVITYLLDPDSGILDTDFVTAGCWFTRAYQSGSQTEEVIEEDVSYLHENFQVEMKEDES
jgi:hypothetical protein